MINRRDILCGLLASGMVTQRAAAAAFPQRERIELLSHALPHGLTHTAPIETLSVGYQWAEGPAWDPVREKLYFTDVPRNIAYQWSRAEGTREFLNPSGVPAEAAVGFREPGANGLWVTPGGDLLICNHGRRAIERLEIGLGTRTLLADRFDGKRFNSPNDLVLARNGVIFFTDPPYGLDGLDASPLKEQAANGVYRLDTDGGVTLLDGTMTRPNGIALSPDEKTLYVAQSDPKAPIIRRFALHADGTVTPQADLIDFAPVMALGPGLADGLVVAPSGVIYTTGPNGVHVLAPDGMRLAVIHLGRPTANCTLGEGGRALFVTSQDRLLRIGLAVE